MTVRCIGTTKKGQPCRNGSEHGYRTCPSHRDAENGPAAPVLSPKTQDLMTRLDAHIAELKAMRRSARP